MAGGGTAFSRLGYSALGSGGFTAEDFFGGRIFVDESASSM